MDKFISRHNVRKLFSLKKHIWGPQNFVFVNNMPLSDMFRFKGPTETDPKQFSNELYTPTEASEAIANIIKYVEEHQDSDLLVTGFDENLANNPLRRERVVKCSVI